MIIEEISILNVAVAFIPVIGVVFLIYRWSLEAKNAIHTLVKILVQLLLVDYVLTTIFNPQSAWVVMVVLLVMVSAASWVALGSSKVLRLILYRHAFMGIVLV